MNYRPISLLAVLDKIFERIIQARLNTFLSENNIVKERQHGFRPYKGTHTTSTITYETIANALTDKKKKKKKKKKTSIYGPQRCHKGI